MLQRSAREALSGSGSGCFGDRERFPGERRLGRFKRDRFKQARVRPDRIARRQEDEVARDEIVRFDRFLFPAAQHAHFERGQVAERFHRSLGPAFLHRADDGIDEDDNQDDHRIAAMTHGKGDDGRDEEDVNERAGKLPQEDAPERTLLRFGQRVRPVLGEAARRLVPGKARLARAQLSE